MLDGLLLTLLILSPFVACRLELYATFATIGITKYPAANIWGLEGCQCNVQYCDLTNGGCHDAHDLVPVVPGKLAGSIVMLQEGTEYEVYVYCSDSSVEVDTITTRVSPVVPQPLRTLYVAPSGIGTSLTCSSVGNPCNLTVALTDTIPGSVSLQAGDRVYLQNGLYDGSTMDSLEIELSNPGPLSPETPVVIVGESRDGVILDSSALLDNLAPVSAGIHRQEDFPTGNGERYEDLNSVFMIKKSDPTQVQRLLRYFDYGDFQTLLYVSPVTGLPNLGFYLDHANRRIEINIGSSVYAEWDFRFAQNVDEYFYVRSDYIWFHDLTMRYAHWGLRVREGSETWLSNVMFDHLVNGLFLYRMSHQTLIEDCTFLDSRFIWQWEAVKQTSPDGSWLESGGLTDGMNVCPSLVDVSEYDVPTNEVDIYENHYSDCRDDAFELDQIASNIRAWNNRMHNVLTGVSQAPARLGPTFIWNNIITDHIGTSFKFQFGNPGSSGTMLNYHNIAITNLTTNGVSIHEYDWRLVKFRNNVFIGYGRSIAVEVEAHSVSHPVDCDYDALFCTRPEAGPDGTHRCFDYLQTAHSSLEDFISATGGLERHGVVLTSFGGAFEDLVTFALSENSLLRGAGEPIKGFNNLGEVDIGYVFNYDPPIAVIKHEAVIVTTAVLITAGVVGGVILVAVVCLASFVTCPCGKKSDASGTQHKPKGRKKK